MLRLTSDGRPCHSRAGGATSQSRCSAPRRARTRVARRSRARLLLRARVERPALVPVVKPSYGAHSPAKKLAARRRATRISERGIERVERVDQAWMYAGAFLMMCRAARPSASCRAARRRCNSMVAARVDGWPDSGSRSGSCRLSRFEVVVGGVGAIRRADVTRHNVRGRVPICSRCAHASVRDCAARARARPRPLSQHEPPCVVYM